MTDLAWIHGALTAARPQAVDNRHVLLAKDAVVNREVLDELPAQYWGEINVGDPRVEEELARIVDAMKSKKLKRLILAPRGHYKTSVTCVEIVRRILVDPNVRILLMSATLPLTKKWLKEVRSHFSGENHKSKLATLFPEYCWTGKKGSDSAFTCPARTRRHLKEQTVTVASPRATQTGQHYTSFFADDLVNSSNFRNVTLLDKLESEFYNFFPLMDPGVSDIIVTGTRYSHADLYARIISKDAGVDEWEIVVRSVYKEDGSLLFPQRSTKDGRLIGFTPEILASLKREDPVMYTCQYENRIVADGDQIFPPDLIQRVTKSRVDPEFPAQGSCLFTVDLANSASSTADSTVIAVGRPDSRGRVWVEDVVGGQWSPYVIGTTLINTYIKYRPQRILIERAVGAEFFVEFLRTLARDRGVTLPLDFIKVSRQKDAKYTRIAALEAAFKTGRMFILAGATDYPKLAEELDQFPRGRYDDRPDCLALLYNALTANIAFVPLVKKLPYFFDVPFSTERKDEPSSLLGDGFSC